MITRHLMNKARNDYCIRQKVQSPVIIEGLKITWMIGLW